MSSCFPSLEKEMDFHCSGKDLGQTVSRTSWLCGRCKDRLLATDSSQLRVVFHHCTPVFSQSAKEAPLVNREHISSLEIHSKHILRPLQTHGSQVANRSRFHHSASSPLSWNDGSYLGWLCLATGHGHSVPAFQPCYSKLG